MHTLHCKKKDYSRSPFDFTFSCYFLSPKVFLNVKAFNPSNAGLSKESQKFFIFSHDQKV